jgi:hypothetical protein
MGAWCFEIQAEKDPAVVREQLERILGSNRYQTDFPSNPLPERLEDSSTGEYENGGELLKVERTDFSLPSPPVFFFFILKYVLYALGIVGGIWLIMRLVLERKRRPVATATPVDLAVKEIPEGLGVPASVLAGEGRFADALHALLLEAIHTLASSMKTPPASSRTSRELIAELGLQDDQRDAFHRLVLAVEQCRFRERTAGEKQYQTGCLLFRQVIGRDVA